MRTWEAVRGAVMMLVVALVVGGPEGAGGALIGTLEEPDGASSGVGNVRGWAFSTIEGATILSPIDVFIDGVKVYEVPCCSGRGDPQLVYPNAPFKTGFSGVYNWGLVEPGNHDVSVVVKSSAGESKTFSRKVTTYRIGEQSFLERIRLTEDSECTFGNSSPGANDASFTCTKLLAEDKDGRASLCVGGASISWDKAAQAFKLTSACKSACTEDADCDDGMFCNGVESCDVESGLCVALSSCPPFLDGCVIRGGLCDEATDSCLDQPNHGDCDDGLFCNGVESCDVATGSCVALSSCPPFQDGCVTRGGLCDEATDTCMDVANDAECDDGLFCNGVESCDIVTGGCVALGSCPPQMPVGCVRPGFICDESTDSCLDELDDAKCPTGDTCQPDGSCLP